MLVILSLLVLAVGCADPAEELNKARVLAGEGDCKAAIKHYVKALESDKFSPPVEAYVELSECEFKEGKTSSAKKRLDTSLTIGMNKQMTAKAKELLGDILLEEGDFDKAIASFEEASKLRQTAAEKLSAAKLERIKVIAKKGDPKAIDEMVKLIETSENLDAGKFKEIVSMPEMAPHSAKLKEKLVEAGIWQSMNKNFSAAEKIITLMTDLGWGDRLEQSDGLKLIANVYAELGRCDEAGAYISRALAANALSSKEGALFGAICLIRSGKGELGLAALEPLIADKSVDEAARDEVIKALESMNAKTMKASMPDAKVRNAPNRTGRVLAKAKIGDKVSLITDKNSNGWYKVAFHPTGQIAYMHESVLTDNPVAISIEQNGWKGAESRYGLAYRTKVRFILYNISEKDIATLEVKLVVNYKDDPSEDILTEFATSELPLKPNGTIEKEMATEKTVKLEIAPPAIRAQLFAKVDGAEFVLVRKFWIKGGMYY